MSIMNYLVVLERFFRLASPSLLKPEYGEARGVGILVFNFRMFTVDFIKNNMTTWYVTLYLETFEIFNVYEQIRQDFLQCIARTFFRNLAGC